MPLRSRRFSALALSGATLVALAVPLLTMNAGASAPRLVVGGVVPLPSSDTVLASPIDTSFDVALTSSHPGALAAFLTSLDDTASLNYHHYLTPAQYAKDFGAPASSVTQLRSYFEQYGLVVDSLSAGHNILRVSGSTSKIAAAFDAPVQSVRLSNGDREGHLSTSATLPAALADDVVAVAGLSAVQPLSEMSAAHALSGHSATTPSTCVSAGSDTGTTPNSLGGYPAQLQAQLYGLTSEWAAGNTGAGQTIAFYELAGADYSDVATYENCYGLTAVPDQINVDGGPTSTDNADGAPAEPTLDIEEGMALAPGANIEVYQGTQNGSGPTDVYAQIASDDTASIVSTSWGICEAQTDGAAQAEQVIFEEMAAQGQTVLAAAGDSGSSDCVSAQSNDTGAAVDDPASQPYVTGVGGLSVNDINPLSETVWNDQCTSQNCGAGGGGMSTLWSRPSWQSAPGVTAADTMRMVPDLSVMGDPSTGFIMYYTGTASGTCHHTCSGGWTSIGGTSIGAPLVSALVATAAQACGEPRLGFINPALYHMASTGFHDVTTGNNDLYDVHVYNATTGYDMASGLGSPDGAAFFSGLCPVALSQSLSSFAVSSLTAFTGSGPTFSLSLRDTADNPVANGAVAISASAPSGVITIDNEASSKTGTGRANEVVESDANGSLSFTVNSTTAQSVTVNVAYDGATVYSSTIIFELRVVLSKPHPPTITSLTALVGGFALKVRAPSNDGGSAITRYEYSVNGGAKWVPLVKGATTVRVTTLRRHTGYHVIARALNAIGASSASASKYVVTRS